MLLAVVLRTITLSRGADVPLFLSAPAVIGTVAAGSPAERAGLKPGDQIVRLGDRNLETWDQLDNAVAPQANRLLGSSRCATVSASPRASPDAVSKWEMGSLGITPVMRSQLLSVDPAGPAARAGLQRGDVLLAVNGSRLDQAGVMDIIHGSAGRPLTLKIERAGMSRDVVVVPEKHGDVGLIGVSINAFEVRRTELNLWQAAKMSVQRNWETTAMIAGTLRGLFRGQTPMRQLMGPVAIAQLSGNAARSGGHLFELMAMIRPQPRPDQSSASAGDGRVVRSRFSVSKG
jgi:regulator of sigma E protease